MALGAAVATAGCGGSEPAGNAPAAAPPAPPRAAAGGGASAFTLRSPAFQEGAAVPRGFTCDGPNLSPPLAWEGVPAGTRSFALLVEDPDAPGGTFTHWIAYNIPAGAGGLPGGATEPRNAAFGGNGFDRHGYGGPCPPPGSGMHHYVFDLYALDLPGLHLTQNAAAGDLRSAIRGHILGTARLTGTYERR